MILYRGTTEYEQDTKKDIIFQTVDWDCEDAIFDEDEDEDNNEKPKVFVDKREFIIRCYGVMKNGTSISALIRNFKPYFYIQVPNNWKQTHATQLLKHLKQKLPTNNGKQIGYYKDAIIKCKLVTKKKFNWFTNDRLYNFVKITTQSKAAMRKVMTYLSKRARERDIQFAKKQNRTSPYEIITCSDPLLGEMDFIQYETNIDPMLRFMHEKEINPAGWIKLKKNKYIINEEDLTNCQVEVEINEKYVSNEINDTIAPLIIANFDIECTSGDGEFPQAERPEDKVIQIGTSVYRYGEKEPYLNHMIVLGECDPIDNCILEKYNSERKVLKAWRDFIVKLDPDIITGYNIFGFDLRYLYERAEFLNCLNDFHYLGRLQNEKSKLEEKKLSSSALGDNFMKLLPMKGRVHIDLMKVIQKDHNLDSYKLENVATHFMGEHKDPVTPRMIFDYYKSGDPEKVAIVAKYCVQDCVLCVNLMNKLNIVTNNIGMANVCTVPLSYLFLRGQGIKIFSLVAKQCKKENFVLPVLKKVEDNDGYEGAIVLVAKKGIYLDTPIAVTDYSSLYPSSMISENLSHDSLVWVKTVLNNKTLFSWEKEQDVIYTDGMENKVIYDNLPGREYENVEYDLFDGSPTEGIKIGKQICRYAQPLKDEDGNFINDTRAVLPRILQHLLKARKDTRKKIPGEEDPFKRFVLDGLQLAYKITCNSLYGQVGASTSQIYKKEIAASTTATGRRLLKLAKDNTEEKFQGNIKININGNIKEVFTKTDCVYGDTDSIFVRFKLTDPITNKEIEGKEALPICIELGKLAGKDVTKQLKPPHDLEYEKTFWPFILFSKKRYAGHLYEEDPEKYKMKSMGIVLKRRDNAPIVKHIYGGVLDIIMNDKDLKKAEIHLKHETKKVMEGKFNIDKFIISKTLRGSYANRQQIAHAALVDRITERDPGNAPQPSDRIPYVYQYLDKKKEETIMNNKKKKTNEFIKEFCNNISSSSKRFENVKTFINTLGQKYCYLGKDQEDLQNSLMELVRNDKYNSIEYMIKTITNNKIKIIQGDKIEDPIFLQQNNLPIDYKFYITNQILKPVSQIFALEIEQLDGFKKHMIDFNLPEKKYLEKSQKLAGDLLFKELLREQENKEKGIQEITKWFKITKI